MADKRKGKRRKEDSGLPFLDEKGEKPAKEEFTVAKWLKKNVSIKRTKFLNHNVEYFTGSKAVDALLTSPWSSSPSEGEEPKFTSRKDVTNYLDLMLRHKFFHRAKKVPVSEQELRAKQKKKEKKEKDDKKGSKDEKENKDEKEKKRKEEETAESSHAEGKESEGGKAKETDDREKKKRKIRLEMHIDQYFVDGLDAYVWIYDPIPAYYWLCGMLLVLGAIAICMFPLWPPSVRMGVYYLSVATAGFLMLIIALALLRLVVFCIVWMLTLGVHHLWLFPNLTEDVGFFASFWPLYQYEYKGGSSSQKSGKKKKKDKDSDNEEEKDDKDSEDKEEGDEEEEEEDDEPEQSSKGDRKKEKDKDGDAEADTKADVPSKLARTSAGTNGEGAESDTETESEGSSQQSQTGKDFEMVEKSDIQDS